MPGSNGNYQKWIAVGKGASAFFGAFSGVMTIGALVVKEGVLIVSAVGGMIVTGCVAGGTGGLWCAQRRRMRPSTVVNNPLHARHVRVLRVTHGAPHNHDPSILTPT